MTELFADGVIVPMIVLLALGWIVPQVLGRLLPEGVAALIVLACVAFVVLWVAGGLFFAGLYIAQGAPMAAFTPAQAVLHFGRLGLLSGIIWLPVMILSVANLPRKWVKEVW